MKSPERLKRIVNLIFKFLKSRRRTSREEDLNRRQLLMTEKKLVPAINVIF
jgi:hypothetical protein